MRVAALGSMLGLAGCLEAPAYACSSDDVCVLNNVSGVCDVPSGTCLYPSGPDCPSMLRDAHGNCFESSSGAGTGEVSTADDSVATTTTDPEETSTSNDAESSTSSPPQTSTSSAAECMGPGSNITAFGTVGASTVFEGFPPILAKDGDPATSWFSTGPEAGATVYSWVLSDDRCIYAIKLTGNGMHDNPSYREDFGFEDVVVKVVNEANDVVFMEAHSMAGTPDPEVDAPTGGVLGSRVVLEFTGHESIDCGGFSELEVTGDE